MLNVICSTNNTKGSCLKWCTVLFLLCVALVQQPLLLGLKLFIYYSFNGSFQPFLNALLLPAMSSLIATYPLVAPPFYHLYGTLFSVVLDNSCQPAAHQCSTGALWSAFWQKVPERTRN